MKAGLQILLAVVLRPVGFVLTGVLLLVAMLFPGQGDLDFSTEEEQPARVSLLDAEPLDRVAVVALFRAGFLRQVLPDPQDPPPEQIASWMTSSFTDECTFSELGRAVLASQGYARPAWRRNLEASTATAWHAVTGHIPDWSYGLGQVRLSVAEAALADMQAEAGAVLGLSLTLPEDRAALFVALQDKCANSLIVEMLLARMAPPGMPSAEAATVYRGGRSWPMLPSVLSYEGLVARIADHVLPAMREQGGEPGITLRGVYDQEFALARALAPPSQGPTPLLCLDDAYVDAYVLWEDAESETGEDESAMIDAATLAAAAQSLAGPSVALTLVQPSYALEDEEVEADGAWRDLYQATEAALLLNRLSLFATRPTLVPEGSALSELRDAQPDCAGWLVMVDGPRDGWDARLRDAMGGKF